MRSLSLLLLAGLALNGCSGTITNPNGKDNDSDGEDTVTEDPTIAFSTAMVDFGDKHIGDRDNSPITVYNHGAGELEVSAVAVDAPYTINPLMFSVTPGGSTTVTVSVTLDGYGDFPATVVFTSNDPANPEATVSVHAHVISDEDGDGHDTLAAGGDDCDDDDATAYPGAPEEWYNGRDENCDGANDYDQDGDGYEAAAYNSDGSNGGGDCQDTNVEYHPGAVDEPYDNRDTDCGGEDDFDYDGDGARSADYGAGTDCDDTDPNVNEDGRETFNAKDDDCNGSVDDDAAAPLAPVVYSGGGTRDRAGYTVALGDLDSDGFAEVLIGAPYVDASASPNAHGRGGLAVFMGGSGLANEDIDRADTYLEGDTTDDLLGTGLAWLPDYTGDGHPDLAVGAPGVSSDSGAIYLFDGAEIDRATSTSRAVMTLSGGGMNSVGRGIGGDLDLDADGLSELTFCYASGGANYLGVSYGGTLTGDARHTDATLFSTDGAGTAFYRNAPVGGDFDGDGYDDLLLADGAADYGSYTNNGALWALWGGNELPPAGTPTDIESVATVLYSGAASEAGAAWAIELAPDWDGDLDDELWIYNASEGLYVVEGGSSRTNPFDVATEASVFYEWASSSSDIDHFALAGDWSGDGLADVLAFQSDQAGSYGDTDLFSSEIQSGSYLQREGRIGHIIGTSDGDSGNAGYGIAPVAADIDGDGDSDVLLGDPEADNNVGRAYVFYNGIIP